MKTSLVSAAAFATSVLAGDPSGLEQMLTQGLMSYAGLSEETTSVNLANEEHASPRVQAFGYETAALSSNGLVGYELGLNADLGWSYELPLYNQDQYLVSRQRGSIYGGGRQYVSFTVYFVKLTVFLDLWLSKFTIDNYLRYDVVNYGDFCNATQWFLDVIRASLLFQLDVNECTWGLIGSITADTEDCEWGTYYIN